MRHFWRGPLSALAVTIAAASGGPATAADTGPLPSKAPPLATASAPSWTGFYIGGAIGSGMAVGRLDAAVGPLSATFDRLGGMGYLGAIYGGFDYQFSPRVVAGVMAEGVWSNIAAELGSSLGGPAVLSAKTTADVSWSVLARIGFLSNPNTLWYVTGGYTRQNMHSTASAALGATAFSASRDDDFSGWTVGVGNESRLFGGWFSRSEYRFTQLGRQPLLGGALGIEPSIHTVRSGLTYKFGQPAGAHATGAAAFAQAAPSWTGIYIGAAAGLGAVVHEVSLTAPGLLSANLNGIGGEGILGSIYGGLDYRITQQFVAGIMADAAWSNIETTLNAALPPIAVAGAVTANSQYSVAARLGWVSNPWTMWYVLAGYAWQNFHSTLNVTSGAASLFSASRDDDVSGWVIGSGLEAALTQNLFIKLEYRYALLDKKTFPLLGGAANVEPSMRTVRGGISYKFNIGGAQP